VVLSCWRVMSGWACRKGTTWGRRMSSLYNEDLRLFAFLQIIFGPEKGTSFFFDEFMNLVPWSVSWILQMLWQEWKWTELGIISVTTFHATSTNGSHLWTRIAWIWLPNALGSKSSRDMWMCPKCSPWHGCVWTPLPEFWSVFS
jgi:hypothetical protein